MSLLLPYYASVCEAKEPRTLQRVRLVLQWLPQAQFAGYYIALEKGFYRKHGIDLQIIDGGPDSSPSESLGSGKAEFATLWLSTAIQRRSEGMRLVNIGQMIQKSSLMLIVRKDSGIKTPADLQNRKVSIFDGDFSIQPKALFRKLSINPRIITQSSTPTLFLRGGVDAVSAMWYNEYNTILNAGLNEDELTTFFYSDYDLNFPEDGIYIMEKFYRDYADVACSFVEASIEGWNYAFSRPEEAVNIVLRRMVAVGVPANRVHQSWMLMRIRDLMLSKGEDAVGRLFQQDYNLVVRELNALGLIKKMPPYEEFHLSCR